MKNIAEHKDYVNPIMLMPERVWREYIGPKASLLDEMDVLPENERLVLALHYYEGLTFGEIGRLLDLKEWDAIVLHAQALAKLHDKAEEEK
jgi:DNA-directed RNA polymerase specialized sigma subunit